MAREVSRAEAWERAHQIFTQVNFNSFDYSTIKESLLDYMKLYYPEDFNDYIESSEFIALLELFAYVGELLAYRLDLNAHENFLTTAERKESVLRLAKLISYKASRNIPARGLAKMQSIQTTETVFDSQGRNLAGRQIIWNDPNNSDWKEQFILVMNRVLEQSFGTVSPSERVQVDDVVFELYTWNNNPLSTNGQSVFSYVATTGGETFRMELAPVELTQDGPEERRPELNAKFSLLFGNDGLGDGSDTTGFLLFTKQGELAFQTTTFDGVTPNQTFDVTVNDINDTDLWLNNVNSDTGAILTEDPFVDILPHLSADELRYGEWVEVDLANAQNIIFNTNTNRRKYEVETLDNDQVRLIFGDGEFSNIPSGTFHVWYRTSANTNVVIPQNAVSGQSSAFTYNDTVGNVQTITFTFSLIGALQNASPSEEIDHIRRVAPSVYYTQDRMVNGRDYNTFMLQDPSILRLRAINRTFAGDSKYIAWHDPRENYEDVKIFGDDLALYWNEEDPNSGALTVVSSPLSSSELIANFIEPLLSSTDLFAKFAPELESSGRSLNEWRRTFNTINDDQYAVPDPVSGQTNEFDAIEWNLDQALSTSPIVDIYYSVVYDEWTVGAHWCQPCGFSPTSPLTPPFVGCLVDGVPTCADDTTWAIRVEARFEGSALAGWDVRWLTRRLIVYSENTRFWQTNTTERIVNFDTLDSRADNVVLLSANVDSTGQNVVGENLNYFVLGQELVEQNLPNAGLPDINRLSVLPEDQNGDGVPDNLSQTQVFDAVITGTWPDPTSDTATELPKGATCATVGSPPACVTVDNSGRSFFNIGYYGRQINNSATKGLDNDIEVYVNGIQRTYASGSLVVTDFEVDNVTAEENLTLELIGFRSGEEPVAGDSIRVVIKDYAYFQRETTLDPWVAVPDTTENRILFMTESTLVEDEQRFRRYPGRYPLNFAWFHYTPRLSLIDPAASNIIDMYIVTLGYYTSLVRWLTNRTDAEPSEPTPLELRTTYADLLDNRMISDTLILHPGRFKILFGSRAIPELRAKFSVIRPVSTNLTDNEVKVRIVDVVRNFFDIESWEFGEAFYFTELAASIHSAIGAEIDSVVLVPTYSQNQFGDLFQVQAREDELFIPDINTVDIEIVQSYTPANIRQNPA